MQHQLTWFGHANFMLKTEGQTLLIDPYFEGNPTCPCSSDSIEKVDAILLTHDHGDHLGQTLEIQERTGAKVVGVFDTVTALMDEGLPQDACLGMNIGGTVETAGVKAHMVQAMHSSVTGVAAGYILTLSDGYCIYHAGDTGIFSSMELFSKFHDIDLALLPIGGHFTMDPKQAAYACKLLKCRAVAGMHWGTFPILEQNTDRFEEMLKGMRPDVKLLKMAPGETIEVAR
jgi:L-ascorbate metabolism protein UlaG (beta-lactamase superfamily)